MNSSHLKYITSTILLILIFPEVFVNLSIIKQTDLENHQRLKTQQITFTELTLGQERFERGVNSPENLYYYINVPKGNFKVEISWLGAFYTLKVDLTLANDSGFTQIIASSTGNQGRSAQVTFNIDQARTIYLNLSLTEDFFFPVDLKILVSRNVSPLNISLITLIVIISLVGALMIAITFLKRKKTRESGNDTKEVIKIVNNEYEEKDARKLIEIANNKYKEKEARELIEMANNEYKVKNYSAAITKWEKAIEIYLKAINKAFLFSDKKLFMENIHIIKKSLCEGYFKLSENQVKKAERFVIQEKLDDAMKELQSARESIQTVITMIKNDKIEINDEKFHKNLEMINIKVEELKNN